MRFLGFFYKNLKNIDLKTNSREKNDGNIGKEDMTRMEYNYLDEEHHNLDISGEYLTNLTRNQNESNYESGFSEYKVYDNADFGNEDSNLLVDSEVENNGSFNSSEFNSLQITESEETPKLFQSNFDFWGYMEPENWKLSFLKRKTTNL